MKYRQYVRETYSDIKELLSLENILIKHKAEVMREQKCFQLYILYNNVL